MAERDHWRGTSHGLNHHQPERFRPADREQQCHRITQEFLLAAVVNFANELDMRAFRQHGRHRLIEIALIDGIHFGGDLDEAREAMTDRYHGEYPSLAHYMQELTEQSITIPKALEFYVDWEAMARDAEMSGDIFVIETAHDEVHVFAGY